MSFKKAIAIATFLPLTICCTTQNKKSIQSNDIVITNKEEVEIEGQFVKIEKINEKEYRLFLKLPDSTVVDFLTLMPLSEHEIALLKPNQNNVRLSYSEYFNKVRNRTEKTVKRIEPVYVFEKNK